MANGRSGALVALVVTVVALAISAVLTMARVTTPTSGGIVAYGHFRPTGVVVEILPDVFTSLQPGDLVVAIDGRSTLAWAEDDSRTDHARDRSETSSRSPSSEADGPRRCRWRS